MAVDEYQVEQVVSEAVGLTYAPQTSKPWQLLKTLTRKAIQKEEGLKRPCDALQENENWQLVNSEFWRESSDLKQTFEWLQENGMEPWVLLYPQKTKEIRHVFDIVRHTNNQAHATEMLNVFDPNHKGKRKDKSKWIQARAGWNKEGKSIVVLFEEWPKPYPVKNHRDQWVTLRPRYRFGPLMTAWLAAMAPRVTHRHLVIRHAIRQLSEFYNDHKKLKQGEVTGPPPQFVGDIKRQEEMREWYAFHTLRRMFRFRFGCSMWQNGQGENRHEVLEQMSSLQQFDLNQDKAWKDYKRAVAIQLKKYSER